MANQQAINTILTVFGFRTAQQQDLILDTEGLDSWTAFISIHYDDFSSIAKNASRHTAPFVIGVLKQKRLAALKFWIEDMIRMNETHTAAAFTPQIMLDYIELYAAYVKAKVETVEFVNGPQFDQDNWIGFETGTVECLASIQGNKGVSLSYLLRDNRLCPTFIVASNYETKIFQNALLTGTDFNHDNKRVWTYMAQRCINTSGWSHIKMFQSTKNGRGAWLAVSLIYGRTAEQTRKMVIARAALETLTWSNESTFKFNDYVTQLINHYETVDRGGQAKTDEEKVTKLPNSMNTSNVPLLTQIELNCIGVTFQNAIVDISTSIAQTFPNVNIKGRRAIVSQTGTSSETSYSTHINGIEFTIANWKRRFRNHEFKCIPKQMRKLIGFAKYYKFDKKKYSAFLAEMQEKINSKKRGQEMSEVSYYRPSQDDTEKDVMDRAVSKIVHAFAKGDTPNNDGAPDEGPTSNANAESSFGKPNAYKGKRG